MFSITYDYKMLYFGFVRLDLKLASLWAKSYAPPERNS